MAAVFLTFLASAATGATAGLWVLGIRWRFMVGFIGTAWLWLAVVGATLAH